jgi:5-methylcytosine-specific restriction endonuclease McrA
LDYGLGKNNTNKADINTPSTDHKIPRSLGGTNDIENLWIICNKCNTLKNNATHEDIQRYENIIKMLKETKTG